MSFIKCPLAHHFTSKWWENGIIYACVYCITLFICDIKVFYLSENHPITHLTGLKTKPYAIDLS